MRSALLPFLFLYRYFILLSFVLFLALPLQVLTYLLLAILLSPLFMLYTRIFTIFANYQMMFMESPTNRIKEVLIEKGIKQTWLAEKLGKSFTIVNSYVCNRRQPSLELLFQIAEILQVNPKELRNAPLLDYALYKAVVITIVR